MIHTKLPGYFVPAPADKLTPSDVVFCDRLYIVQIARHGFVEARRITTKEIFDLGAFDVTKALELITGDYFYVWATHPQRWLGVAL